MKFAYLVAVRGHAPGYFFTCDASRVRESVLAHECAKKVTVDAAREHPRWSVGKATFDQYSADDFKARRIPGIRYDPGTTYFDFSEWPQHVRCMRLKA